MEIIVNSHQSLFDLALQVYGDASRAFDLAEANGLAITDELKAGQVLIVDDTSLASNANVRYYAENTVISATSATARDMALIPTYGIGKMAIEFTFEVA